MIEALVFYMFAFTAVAAGVMVISSKNPVHSVLFLILAFFNAAGLFVLLGAEFLAMLLIIVYVGAVAVLFLFVVMMLDINQSELKQGFLQYLPIGAVIGGIMVVELILIVAGWQFAPDVSVLIAASAPEPEQVSNTRALGNLIYTRFAYLFQASGLILLVAMIGAITLTHRRRKEVKKQSIADQIAREDSIEMKKVESGRGI
ncbi:MAG: NADH-quinone oxidoreductase subunit J [Rhodospirillaceae bacterium]|nr:NADH-quinone oxidoreductase subunit J [Rhodospirillaceae bacterium]